MGSDRARVSYDPYQQYRSVMMQQGRVTLEADFNEEVAIAGEELREETLDIVGPNGTPDDGYLVTPLSTPPFDFFVRSGTMYVGGVRVATPPGVRLTAAGAHAFSLPGILRYTTQKDWLDSSDDSDWVDTSKNPPTNEFIYLFLREQEVSAVEDSDLKDIALGGPDTAQRTRLIQHIVRLASDPTCNAGLVAARNKWRSEGLGFNARTMRLESATTLRVSFTSSSGNPDPCNPQAQGGFLGADNQLIRVQISGIDKDSGNPKFVWGFDDASFLYRLDLDPKNQQLLHLQSPPVDASHQPRAQQAVEVLRSAAELSNGEYVASPSGIVFTLDNAYNQDSRMISLPAVLIKLPDEYYDPLQTPRVFLRVWEEEHVFTPGTAVDLGNTGLQVTLDAGREVFHTGDYWLFAVRPSTPQQVYPERYINNPQPPEGPRMWACPLGVITWSGQAGTAQDCRKSFSPLVELVTVEHEGNLVGVRNTLNFTGRGVTAVTDNPAAKRIDIQIAGGGGPGESSPTLLLFPYCKVTFQSFLARASTNADTLIAISSTTANPFGPVQPAGPVTLYCYGANLPSSPLIIPSATVLRQPTLSAGQMTTFNLSDMLRDPKGVPITKELTFEGYLIADCAFAGAYGFAEVSRINQGPQQNLILADSYLAIVLPRPAQPAISSLTPAAQTIPLGGSATFTVTLTANVSGNTDVQISLSAPGIANVPSTATIQAGSASTTFTASGISSGTVTITVALAGVAGSATATLAVQPISVLIINAPKFIADGGSEQGTVTLNGPAPGGGATVILASSNSAILQVDPQVVVPPGSATSPTFNISATNASAKVLRASITAEFPQGTKITHLMTVVGQVIG